MQEIKNLPWISGGKRVHVAVIGDIILDEYLDGDVSRISPEAPVPVHLVQKSFRTAGGAANVARNIKRAGGIPLLYSVWGNDETAQILKTILEEDEISTSGIVTTCDRPTVKKTRVSANNQQIVRIDWERVHPICSDHQQAILSQLKTAKFDILLISDYGKGTLPVGFLAALLELARERNTPSLVDPKGKDFSRYLHATLVTPNRKEACDALSLEATDRKDGIELGRRLQSTFGLKDILVTMGPEGMVFVPSDRPSLGTEPIHVPALPREVFDVSGAGDTVIALLALALGCKSSMATAMHLANLGAGLVVEKWGTQPITQQELESALQKQETTYDRGSKSKILDLQSIINIVGPVEKRAAKVVFTNGCFDLIHAGHISYLEKARAKGDLLIVGINSDASISRLKGPDRPIIHLEHRAQVLAALACVDYVIPFDDDTPARLIEHICPDILIKGADWQKNNIIGAGTVQSYGGLVDTIELVPGISSTEIVRRIRDCPAISQQ